MSSYNTHLLSLRKKENLTIKEASKKMKINPLSLYFYENGYFRPGKRHLAKIESYYNEKISLDGVDAYPTPTIDREVDSKVKKSRFIKKIVLGSISIVMLAISITGGVLFSRSTSNVDPYYGDVYNELRDVAVKRGQIGHDLVTNLTYYQLQQSSSNEQGVIVFYQNDSLLYFNECQYTATVLDESLGTGRYHFKFGGDLGVSSNTCTFTYGSISDGTFFSCNFDYNNEAVKEIRDFKIIVKSHTEITEALAKSLINSKIQNVDEYLSNLIRVNLEKEVDFYKDFLPAREQGRKINFNLQIAGLSLLIPGVFLFFVFGGFFTRMMVANIKPRLEQTSLDSQNEDVDPLPKDINLRFGIPDYVEIFISRLLVFGSIFFMAFGFISKLGIINVHPFFNSQGFLSFLQLSLLSGIFLNHIVTLGRHKRPEVLLKKIILFTFLFLAIATMETVVISITNAWGYNFASLIYSYLPSNVFQVIAIQYVIYLFLFFQPPFLNKRKKWVRYLWHGLSFIPLGFLIAVYFISNAYVLTYGVKENIYVNFWFLNGFLALSIVATLFMYTIFGLSLFLEKKYGQRNSQLFFYGDRYTLIENLVLVFYIALIGAIDFIFINNQYAYYLGLGFNRWIFTLIPLVMFVKYSPNRKQTLLLENEFKELSRKPA